MATVVVVSYLIGAVAANMLFLFCHECAHDLCAPSRRMNKALAMVFNLPLVIPFVSAFRRYHMDHHAYLDDIHRDMDIPSEWEARVFRGPAGKFVWLVFQIVAYALRPCVVKPLSLTLDIILNGCAQLLFVLVWGSMNGTACMAYLLLSAFFAGGLHPVSAHFLSEHFDFNKTGEATSSYYGILNTLSLNVGHHATHHDYPRVPWRFLPEVTKRHPEKYDRSSVQWLGMHVRFVLDDEITLSSRRSTFCK
jgi:sphingolipid 4-desaturase/C4-monooxygenase